MKIQIVFYNEEYDKKKTPEEFHIFVIFFAIPGIQTDLPTLYLILKFGN